MEPEVASEAPPESERDLLAKLKQMVEGGQLHLTVDRSKLSHLDFPLSSEADGNLWVYSLTPLCALILWRVGLWPGLAASAISIALYQTLGKTYIARRLDRRIRERGLSETDTWRALWRFGGVILTPADGGPPCQGPEGSWFALARGVARPRPSMDSTDAR
ncbi:MAG: hypothetical protein WCC64_05995 [Aliidongia sp.]